MWVFVGQGYTIWLHVRRSLRSSICTQCTEDCSKTKIEGIIRYFSVSLKEHESNCYPKEANVNLD